MLIRWFIRRYDVDLAEVAEQNLDAYTNFNSFFIRALRPDTRPVNRTPGVICSPADCTVSQLGHIKSTGILQAKGRDFSVTELVGGDAVRAALFENGDFATLYLSPKDYHRVHMPYAGRLIESVYVPGRLFSVAAHTTRTIPKLFARNERLVTIFETEVGPMAVILVGAIFVACIETVWGGTATPPHGKQIRVQRYPSNGNDVIQLDTGDELGRFNMGSTVVLLFGPERIAWHASLSEESPLQMGRPIGNCIRQGDSGWNWPR
ncbi:MAG: archaetidylserine decarboxylase [Gammaproteobacteria bacterium]